jgi:heme-degrading monooxygenase HmoA
MVAAMATISGPAEGLAEIARMATESVESWLRGYDGYRGLLVFTDEDASQSRVVTLWESAEAEAKARAGRGAMRDQVAAAAGMEVVDFGVYEVAVFEVPEPGR